MAIFGFKKKEEAAGAPKEPKAKKPASKKAAKPVVVPLPKVTVAEADAIIRPRVTEKSGILSQGGVYTFEVRKGANKNTIAKALKAIYKVVPVKIAIINQPAKEVFVKGKWGTVDGFKKAVVTLKKGDKIDFV